MNLAYWKYRNVVSLEGPIIKLTHVMKESFILGCQYFDAFAELSPEISNKFSQVKKQLYTSRVGGGGHGFLKTESFHRAISEALERWAYIENITKKAPEEYGFQIDSSTTGMSAFPSFTAKYARKNALFEARERYSISAWWEGFLSAQIIDNKWENNGLSCVKIQQLWDNTVVVITYATLPKHPNFKAYAFAAGETIELAILKSLVELERNINVLTLYLNKVDRPEIENLDEKNLFYFSTETGYDHFISRIKTTSKELFIPKLVVDTEIIGEWSKYTKVWRCLYDPSILRGEYSDDVYFIF